MQLQLIWINVEGLELWPRPSQGILIPTLSPLSLLCLPPAGGGLWDTSMQTSALAELKRFENH